MSELKLLTDNEIIKGMACCYGCGSCNDCPYYPYCKSNRFNKVEEDALDLLVRQKAEIEKLELLNASLLESCEGYSKSVEVYKAEIERLNNHILDVTKKVKADAVKEFAERLKAKFDKYGVDYTAYTMGDDIVKEMVGEDK